MMLLVGWENQVVEHLATRDGGIVAQEGINQPGTILEVGIVAQDKAHGNAVVKNVAAVANDTVNQDNTFADLGRFLFAGVDGDVFQFAGSLDVTMGADFYILDDAAVFDDAATTRGAEITAAAVHAFLGDAFQVGL